MLPHPDRFRFQSAPPSSPRILLVWFVLLALLAVLSVGVLVTAIVQADGTGPSHTIRPHDATHGTLLFRGESPDHYLVAPLLHTDVRMTISGPIVRATVRQQFKNNGSEWAEGIYVFPLPETAAVDHLSMHIGERIIEGMVKERTEAKQTYEKAKSEGTRAALVEQERPNIFTASVANIGPGDEVTVEIQYQQTLHYDGGQFGVRFPLVIGPRYIPGVSDEENVPHVDGHGWATDTDQVPDASRTAPPVLHPKHGAINPVSLTIDLKPGFPLNRLESPHHSITKTEQDGGYLVTLADESVPADRDFELTWQPAEGHAPAAALLSEQKDGKAYALFMVMPPAASAIQAHRTPREVVFIIDTSGSMHGQSMEQAKAALRLALARLAPDDTFNLIQFNSTMDVLFADAVPADRANITKATHYVSRLSAQGGTEMLPALQRALIGKTGNVRLRQVIFLTDGQVGNEEELFKTISARLGESRLFTIGIGSAPNSYFMRKAAEFGRGTFTYIGKTAEVQEKMEALFRKIEQPALTDIIIDLPPDAQTETFPRRIPDLYAGEPIVVSLKADALPDQVVAHGRFGQSPWKTTLMLSTAPSREALSIFWARAKIESLMNHHIHGSEGEVTRRAMIEVALQHHLVSRYTSLVAVDMAPARPSDESLTSHAMKTNLPHGQDYEHIFGLPQTATAAPVQLLGGVVCLWIAWMIFILKRLSHAA